MRSWRFTSETSSGWTPRLLCSGYGVQAVCRLVGAFRPSKKCACTCTFCLDRTIADRLLLIKDVTDCNPGQVDGELSSAFLFCVFLDTTLCCSPISRYQFLGRKNCLHLQDVTINVLEEPTASIFMVEVSFGQIYRLHCHGLKTVLYFLRNR
jgi:hypothetical protein